MRMRSGIGGTKPYVLVGLCLGLAVVAAGIWSLLSGGGGPTTIASGSADVGRGVGTENQEPCLGNGTRISLEDANIPYVPLVPDDALANSSTLTGVWECTGTTQTEQYFSSGVRIFEDENTIKDPENAWRTMAKDSPSDTFVGEVLGQPAAVISPHDIARGSVSVVLGDVWIVVEGNGKASAEELLKVAQSLQRTF